MIKCLLLAVMLLGAAPGGPDVALRSAVIQAGGGPRSFDTGRLFHALAGPLAGPEFAKLRFQYGRTRVDQFMRVFNFIVADLGDIASVAPRPDPHDAKALAAALLDGAKLPDGRYSVDRLLDRLLSESDHARIAADVTRSLGNDADTSYHVVLLQALQDMKRANRL